MPIRLDMRRDTFAVEFDALLATKREISDDVDQTVAGIIAEVVARGDAALHVDGKDAVLREGRANDCLQGHRVEVAGPRGRRLAP